MQLKKTDFVSERGQALMEFAFSLIVLLILLAGAFDMGRAYFVHTLLVGVAGDAALMAGTCRVDQAYVESVVQNATIDPRDGQVYMVDLSEAVVDCQYWRGGYPDGTPEPCSRSFTYDSDSIDTAVVKVTYNDFQITMPLIGTLIGRQTLSISAEDKKTIFPTNPNCP